MGKKKSKSNIGMLLPIIIMAGFIPCLVHSFEYNTHLSSFDWFPDSAERQVDFFLGYKSYGIMIVGAIAAMLLVYRFFIKGKSLRFETPFWLLIAYTALMLLSAFTCDYTAYAFRGGYEIFESAWVLLAYMVICYYTYNFVVNKNHVYSVIQLAAIGVGIVTLIGLFQFAKLDLFRTEFGKRLITAPSYWNNLDGLSFTFKPGQIYTTLYNIDFLSFYYGMMVPLGICFTIGAKKKSQKIVGTVFSVAFILCLIGSSAASGIVALCGSAVVAMYILLSRHKKAFIAALCVGAVGLCGLVYLVLNSSYVKGLETEANGCAFYYDSYAIKEIDTNDDNVVFTINDDTLTFSYEYNEMTQDVIPTVTDGAGNEISYINTVTEEGNIAYRLNDYTYGECTLVPILIDNYYCLQVNIDNTSWNFTNQTDGTYYYYNPWGKFVKFPDIAYSRFVYDRIFSGRGPIWNRTIPLLKNYIFLGAGANNYALVFPQDDYIMKVYQNNYAYDVKAHCWYLQQWVENGLIALLCLLAFYIWYFVRSVRIYNKANLKDDMTMFGFGILIATITYMIVALLNDSNVTTAPVFWVLMGLGMAVNRLIVKEQGLFVKEAADGDDNTVKAAEGTGSKADVAAPKESDNTSSNSATPKKQSQPVSRKKQRGKKK